MVVKGPTTIDCGWNFELSLANKIRPWPWKTTSEKRPILYFRQASWVAVHAIRSNFWYIRDCWPTIWDSCVTMRLKSLHRDFFSLHFHKIYSLGYIEKLNNTSCQHTNGWECKYDFWKILVLLWLLRKHSFLLVGLGTLQAVQLCHTCGCSICWNATWKIHSVVIRINYVQRFKFLSWFWSFLLTSEKISII